MAPRVNQQNGGIPRATFGVVSSIGVSWITTSCLEHARDRSGPRKFRIGRNSLKPCRYNHNKFRTRTKSYNGGSASFESGSLGRTVTTEEISLTPKKPPVEPRHAQLLAIVTFLFVSPWHATSYGVVQANRQFRRISTALINVALRCGHRFHTSI